MKIKVTLINNRYHARLTQDDNLLDEMACAEKQDIGWICREMLKWQDKLGNSTPWTVSARERHNLDPKPTGKIWYKNQL